MSADGMLAAPEQLELEDAIRDAIDLELPGCWKLAQSAWVDLEYPHYGRVLLEQRYERHPERVYTPENGKHRSKLRLSPASQGDIDARLRMRNGAANGKRNGGKARAWLQAALQNPETHSLGVRKLVSTEIYPPRWADGPLQLKVVCKCGQEQLVPGRPYVLKQSGVGRQCAPCNRREVQRLGAI
jgi:hypothetical protein